MSDAHNLNKVEVIEMTPTTENSTHTPVTRTASTIALLAGIWFFISPWVYGSYLISSAWNNWIVGIVITILAALRLSSNDLDSTQWMSWVNCLLGIWTFASPWIFAESNGRFINSLCVGVIVFASAISSATARPHTSGPMPRHA